jgi:hypothetical protein
MSTLPRKRIRTLTLIVLAAGICVVPAVRADVYTWVDVKGNVNVGNLEPPEGARILGVTRENPVAKAQADAAREAARQNEVKALAERVAELESKTEAAFNVPPPASYGPPPAYAPPMAPPQVTVVVMPAAQPDETAAYAPYGCAWIGCAWAPFGYPVFVTAPPRRHRDFGHPSHPIHAPPRFTPPAVTMPVASQPPNRPLRG